MRVLWAFLRRDLAIAASYKLGFAFTAVGGLVTLATFFFLARTVGDSPLLQSRYGADYFSFALLGIAVATALRTVQTSFAQKLREAQTDGSLEVLLAAPLSTPRLLALMGAWPVALALVRALALLGFGALWFGARLRVDVPAFLAVLLLSLLAFCALGLISAAFVLTFKRADPFSYLVDVATYLLSGVIYPVEVLPGVLQAVSRLLPATWALHGLRASALQGASLSEIPGVLVALAVFCVVLWPVAWLCVSLARREAERRGTVAHF